MRSLYILIIFCISLCTSCTDTTITAIPEESSSVVSTATSSDSSESVAASPNYMIEDKIDLVTKDVSENSLKLTIYNNTDDAVHSGGNGSEFVIQKFEENTGWNDLPFREDEEFYWNEEELVLKPGEKAEFEIEWTYCYGNLTVGKYRILKPFWKEKINTDVFYGNSEFTIS